MVWDDGVAAWWTVQKDSSPLGSKLWFTHAAVRTIANAQEYAADQKLILTDSIERVLSHGSIDAFVLATPHDEHQAQLLAAAGANKHVFVEKPLAFKLADAVTAVSFTQERKRVLAVGYNRRFLPAARKLKEDIANGSFGDLLRFEGNFSNNSGLTFSPGMWRASEGGAKAALSAMGVHVLDFFIYLHGPIESVRVTSSRRSLPVPVDDVVCVNLTFRSGAQGVLSTLLTTPRHWRIQIFGTKQWAHMRDEHLLEIGRSSGPVVDHAFEIVDTVRLELEAFADAIGGKSAYLVSPADAAWDCGARGNSGILSQRRPARCCTPNLSRNRQIRLKSAGSHRQGTRRLSLNFRPALRAISMQAFAAWKKP